MTRADLAVGEKYIVDCAPWGPIVVRFLGPSKWFPSRSRVQHSITRMRFTVPTASLRPALVLVQESR